MATRREDDDAVSDDAAFDLHPMKAVAVLKDEVGALAAAEWEIHGVTGLDEGVDHGRLGALADR